MPNANYIKGRAKEYKVKKQLEDDGWIVLRTAGSHGFADLVAVKRYAILFVQVKPDNYPSEKLDKEFKWINGDFYARFEVR